MQDTTTPHDPINRDLLAKLQKVMMQSQASGGRVPRGYHAEDIEQAFSHLCVHLYGIPSDAEQAELEAKAEQADATSGSAYADPFLATIIAFACTCPADMVPEDHPPEFDAMMAKRKAVRSGSMAQMLGTALGGVHVIELPQDGDIGAAVKAAVERITGEAPADKPLVH